MLESGSDNEKWEFPVLFDFLDGCLKILGAIVVLIAFFVVFATIPWFFGAPVSVQMISGFIGAFMAFGGLARIN